MRRIAGSFGLWFAGFAAASSSAQLIVDPSFAGGFATIQPALDAAAPDQTILVMPGTYSGPIVITKPVKLLGIGMPEILHGAVPTGSWSSVWRCVELQGPGWGKVVLAGFKIGSPNACTWTAYPIYPCISGSGFEELHVVRCQVHGPIPGCLTGVAKGFPALRVVVPLVILAHSSLKGSPTLSDWVWPVPQAEPSVDVTGCVAILDSVVHGTAAEDPYWIVGLMGPAPPFPCPCPELMGNNSGSAGVKATLGFVVNSEISGGPGGKVVLSAPEGTFPYGSQPSGPAWTGDSTVYAVPAIGLEAPSPMTIGQPWSLAFPVEWSQSTLYASLDMSLPYAWGAQFAFMQTIDAAAPLVPGTTFIGLTWPDASALLGIEIVWQLYDPVLGLSRPVFDILMY